jgi:hypothetical protein
MPTIPTNPRFDSSNTARTFTGALILLSPTEDAAGTSDGVVVAKKTGPLIFQINDSDDAATVAIQSSLDGENWSDIATYAAGVVVSSPSAEWFPRLRVVWSGNTGTLAVICAGSN